MLEYFDSFDLFGPKAYLLTVADKDLLQLVQVSLRKDERKQGNYLGHGHQVPLDDVFGNQISLFLYEIIEGLLSQNIIIELFGNSFQIEVLQVVYKFETRGI